MVVVKHSEPSLPYQYSETNFFLFTFQPRLTRGGEADF